MNFSTALALLLWGQATIRRASRAHITYVLDGAEGVRIWQFDATDDSMDPLAKFGVMELVATDWQVCPPGSKEYFPDI